MKEVGSIAKIIKIAARSIKYIISSSLNLNTCLNCNFLSKLVKNYDFSNLKKLVHTDYYTYCNFKYINNNYRLFSIFYWK